MLFSVVLLVDPVMSCKLSLIIGIYGCSAVIYTVIFIFYFIKVCVLAWLEYFFDQLVSDKWYIHYISV